MSDTPTTDSPTDDPSSSESSSDFASTRYLLIALAGIAVLAVAGVTTAFVTGVGGGAPPQRIGDREQLTGDWPSDAGETVRIRLDRSSGPIWVRDGGTDLQLAPRAADQSIDWRHFDTGEGDRLVGTSRRHGTEIQYEWLFRSGDPQARFSVRLPEVDLETLRDETITTSFELPADQLRSLGRRLQLRQHDGGDLPRRLGPSIPLWVQWQGDGDALTFTDWSADGWSLRRTDNDEAFRVDLHVWRPQTHSALRDCELTSDDSAPTVALRADTTVTFGRAPRVVSSPLPEGRAAGVVPIFDLPAAHPDETLHDAQPNSPEDWAARAKTLAYGHSNSGDPRYGNGGLLGHDLGGTIALPAKWADAERVRQFVRATDGSGIDVAVRGADALPDGEDQKRRGTSSIAENLGCRALIGETPTTPAAVTGFRPFRGTFDAESLHPGHGRLPASGRPYRLDGSRSALVDSALASQTLQTLLEHRGTTAFSTPLLGSRNPLVPAAREALLSPERDGEWTLSSPFAESLANVSILRETEPIWVGSLSEIARYWRGIRRAQRRWTPNGDLLVQAGGDEPVPGFTLLVGGRHISKDSLTVEGADRVEVRHGSAPTTRDESLPQTWISWALKPGESTRIEFDGDSAGDEMSPVQWAVVD